MNHSPEPWITFEDKQSEYAYTIMSGSEVVADIVVRPFNKDRANADRIAACVNALAGIPTEVIKTGVIGALVSRSCTRPRKSSHTIQTIRREPTC
jgi:hypothetical protein